MNHTRDFIDALANGSDKRAGVAFNAAMDAKMEMARAVARITMTSEIYNKASSESEKSAKK
jgi:hypothetical protein